jgi:hypothetical protein
VIPQPHPSLAPADLAAGVVVKLPGDGAPPIEPPPQLKDRIMSVVLAESGAPVARGACVELHATVSVAAAPRSHATLTVTGGAGLLRVWALPAPPPGHDYRAWLLSGAGPRAPQPGPVLGLDAHGSGVWELGDVSAVDEVAVALECAGAPAGRVPVLRVSLPRPA